MQNLDVGTQELYVKHYVAAAPKSRDQLTFVRMVLRTQVNNFSERPPMVTQMAWSP